MAKTFDSSQLEAIARALGDTDEGLTNTEIEHLFSICRLTDPGPGTKWKRIYYAFVENQNAIRKRTHILEFIRQSLKPVKYVKSPRRFEQIRSNVNNALLLCGLVVEENGKLISTKSASTISEARSRARALKADLTSRGVHKDVLKFCQEELVADNYFHAVLEAVKSVAEKLRDRTGLTDDGGALVDRALTGNPPLLAINDLGTESQRSEQRGFANLVKGTFGMFRNPLAHEAKINWDMKKEDAEDLFSLLSLIHRRIDNAVMPPRI